MSTPTLDFPTIEEAATTVSDELTTVVGAPVSTSFPSSITTRTITVQPNPPETTTAPESSSADEYNDTTEGPDEATSEIQTASWSSVTLTSRPTASTLTATFTSAITTTTSLPIPSGLGANDSSNATPTQPSGNAIETDATSATPTDLSSPTAPSDLPAQALIGIIFGTVALFAFIALLAILCIRHRHRKRRLARCGSNDETSDTNIPPLPGLAPKRSTSDATNASSSLGEPSAEKEARDQALGGTAASWKGFLTRHESGRWDYLLEPGLRGEFSEGQTDLIVPEFEVRGPCGGDSEAEHADIAPVVEAQKRSTWFRDGRAVHELPC